MVVQKTDPIVRDTLFYMNIVGMNPEKQNAFAKARTALTITLGAIITTFILLEMIINWTGIESLLDGADIVVALAGLLVKMLLMILHSGRINKLLDSIQQFGSFANTKQGTNQEVDAIHRFVKKFRRGMKICYITTNTMFYIKPLILRSKTLPARVYQPFDLLTSPRYEIAYIVEYLNAILMLTAMLSFDLLFILFITHAMCELKMVKYEFANFKINPNVPEDEGESLKELSEVVQRHVSVLGFIKELNHIFSDFMLSEFIGCTFCICLGLFSLSNEGFPPSPTIFVKYALFIFSYTAELYVFCYSGNILSEEGRSVADAAYESDWWVRTQPKLRRAMLLVMLRAQKAEKITVGGMFDLDLKCFTNVVHTAFSFFTLMQAMQREQQISL